MKRIIVAMLLTFVVTMSYSQFNKGNLLLGGTIGYSKNNLNGKPLVASDYENKTFAVLPNAGLFIAPFTVLGIGVGYSNVNTSVQETAWMQTEETLILGRNQISVKQNFIIANPYVRVYRPIGNSLALFLEFNIGYGHGKGKNETDTFKASWELFNGVPGQIPLLNSNNYSVQTYRQTIWGANLNPGISFFPSPKWALDMTIGAIGYTRLITNGNIESKDSDVNVLTDFSNVALGIKYIM